jgi:signal peptidase I
MLSGPPDHSVSTPLAAPGSAVAGSLLEPVAQPAARRRPALREYGEAFVTALLIALLIRSFAVQAFKIPSGSMLPTLQIGDHILVNKFIYGIRLPILGSLLIPISSPQRGDVVVFVYPVDSTKDFIKRVVGVPGDVIQIRDKHVYVNGERWGDSHAYFADGPGIVRGNGPRDNYGPITVPSGSLFVMGDNRDRSYDSRFWGFVTLDDIQGKAFLIYWSWDGDDGWVRWNRLGRVIE